MVVLHQHHGAADVLHFSQESVGELAVHFLIVLPIARPENRTRVSDVAQRPEPFVGESVVVAGFFLLR